MKKHKKLARIIRFVPHGTLPRKTAAVYDKEKNIMTVDKDIYDHVNVHFQTQMMFADGDVVIS